MITRNKQHEYALSILYMAFIYQKAEIEFDPIKAIESLTEADYYDNDIFLRELVIKTLIHQNEIITIIAPQLTKWTFSRLNVVSQVILLMSYSHFYYISEKVDKSIVIDVAIKLAKKFIPEEDYKYINAVLDKVLQ